MDRIKYRIARNQLIDGSEISALVIKTLYFSNHYEIGYQSS